MLLVLVAAAAVIAGAAPADEWPAPLPALTLYDAFFAGAVARNASGNATSMCVRELHRLRHDAPATLLAMLDASGKVPPSNLMQRPPSVWSLGDYEECRALGPEAHYCVAALTGQYNAFAYQYGTLGVCLPRVCSESALNHGLWELGRLLAALLANATAGNHSLIPPINATLWNNVSSHVHCAAPTPWSPGALAALAVCAICVTLTLLATAEQWWQRHQLERSSAAAAAAAAAASPGGSLGAKTAFSPPLTPVMTVHGDYGGGAVNTSVQGLDEPDGDEPAATTPLLPLPLPLLAARSRPRTRSGTGPGVGAVLGGSGGALLESPGSPPPAAGTLRAFLRGFSLYETVPALTSVTRRKGSIHCFDGLRTLAMLWVVLGHTWLWIAQQGPDNPAYFEQTSETVGFQFIVNAPYAVDVFFYLSGFLVAFTVLGLVARRRAPGHAAAPWWQYYLHRYLRITPAYAFVLLVYAYLTPHFGTGPLWYRQQAAPNGCSRWWANLLYIQNLYPFGNPAQECMNWAWYLATDMQFYWLSPLLLVAFHRAPRFGFALWVVTLLAGLATSFALAYVYHLSPNALWGLPHSPYEEPNPKAGDITALIDNKPWARLPCYLLGMLTAYAYRSGRTDWLRKAPRRVIALGSLMAAGLFFLTVFCVSGTRGRLLKNATPSQFAEALWIALGRLVLGLSIAWLTLICIWHRGGLIGYALSAQFWLPLGRLTYTVYLVHPLVLSAFFASFQQPLHFTVPMGIAYFFNTACLSYLIAFAVALFVEFPFSNLDKLFSGTKPRSG